ncbi:MAG TPA: site-2 protease family protein [Enhygromyxa sp.]|nr:site-2 protease family protein [Enhygromyxa sp.]
MSTGGINLGKLFGVGLRIDWSLLIIFAIIVFELGAAVFPAWHPEWSAALIWTMALAAAVLFFASILAHELSHALVARAQGIPVRRITLFLFGGLTQLEGEPKSPKAEFWMAVIGPVVSAVIGLAATFIGAALVGAPMQSAMESGEPLAIQAAYADAGPFATLLLWLGPINLLLGIFNIIPGFPLDGGRVLRSIIWGITDDLRKATRWASLIGQVFAWALMAFGVLNFFAGAWTSGLWLLLIGWFLNNAARMSYQQLLIRQALENVPVSQVMRSSFATIPPDLTVEEFMRDHALSSEQQVFPIEVDGYLLGTVGIEQVRHVPRDEWPRATVEQIMIPRAQLPTLPPDAGAERALFELARSDVDQLVILEGRKLLGLVRREDLLRWLDIHEWMMAAEG